MERLFRGASTCAASAALERQALLAEFELPDATVWWPSWEPGELFSSFSRDAASSPETSSVVPCEPPLPVMQDQRAPL